MPTSRRLFCFISVLCLLTPALRAQDYTSIVVFGDSLSDTGNDADLTGAKYGIRVPGLVADYTDGRFTDGALTYPASYKYAGVWVEQLAAMLPHQPVVLDSLNGGSNYAYGFATTNEGTGNFTFGPGNVYSVTVDNVGLQISTYLATHPKIDHKTLFVVWAGAINILDATTQADVSTAAILEALDVEQLIQAGATDFIIPNLPPLGATPRLNGSPLTSVPATQASVLFNDTLAAALKIVEEYNRDRHISLFQLDVYSLFNKVIATPHRFKLTNVTASSQALPVDPDDYLFWDDIHPTTHGHHILAAAAAELIAEPRCKPDYFDRDTCHAFKDVH